MDPQDEGTGLFFRVLHAQANTTLFGDGWVRAIHYSLQLQHADPATAEMAPAEPEMPCTLSVEYADGVEPNPDWGKLTSDEPIEEGDPPGLVVVMPAPLEAVEALIRDAARELPSAIVVFVEQPRRRARRPGAPPGLPDDDDIVPVESVMIASPTGPVQQTVLGRKGRRR